jgi:SRSO17 transposase
MVEKDLDPAEVRGWAVGLSALHQTIAKHFARAEPRQQAYDYLRALISPIERKNGWQIAEHVGQSTPDGVQRLLATAHWDADKVRDDLQTYVVERLGDPQAVLIIDETGFLKKGTKSVGVKRQYTGTAGKRENCQVGVFLAYASPRGRTFLDRELYLPQEWAADLPRREEAGVPEHVSFQTKPQLAQQMLERARTAGVPAKWVCGDSVYGTTPKLREWLEETGQAYVLAVASNLVLWSADEDGLYQETLAEYVARQPQESWVRLSAGAGSKGPRVYDWLRGRLAPAKQSGWEHWWLARRSLEEPSEVAYYFTFAPEETGLETLVGVAGVRWAVEEGLETAKGEVGLDQYEVRKWTGWYRHITLALLAHAFLTVTRSKAVGSDGQKGGPCGSIWS